MCHIALEVPLRPLALCGRRQRHHPDEAGVQQSHDALDHASLPRGVAPFEDHDHPEPFVTNPLLELQELHLEAPQLPVVLLLGEIRRPRWLFRLASLLQLGLGHGDSPREVTDWSGAVGTVNVSPGASTRTSTPGARSAAWRWNSVPADRLAGLAWRVPRRAIVLPTLLARAPCLRETYVRALP